MKYILMVIGLYLVFLTFQLYFISRDLFRIRGLLESIYYKVDWLCKPYDQSKEKTGKGTVNEEAGNGVVGDDEYKKAVDNLMKDIGENGEDTTNK